MDTDEAIDVACLLWKWDNSRHIHAIPISNGRLLWKSIKTIDTGETIDVIYLL